ncbi:50S ribosomal protein L21 [Candidatus Hodgkinia cicadicola]|uniref:50S ribosomal protein L21 n=1 Tax=Candidatus Hodgkinia cicadicola TaxID=573658 RepID=A0ABX4MGG1_9HYPH|nr:50S ribosomal protein L21 [Candidatus Hodgkinia cicadicola]
MIVQLNNKQYKVSKEQMIGLKIDGVINHRTIVVAKVLMFKCGNDLIYTNNNNWLALGKIIGKNIEEKDLICKFKRRKGYKRRHGFRNNTAIVYFTKIINIGC